jgi:chromosomal replication initiation ATPase DnaA
VKNIAVARQCFQYCSLKFTKASLALIGSKHLRDHSTVLHSFKAIQNLIDCQDKDYYPLILQVLCDINDHCYANKSLAC